MGTINLKCTTGPACNYAELWKLWSTRRNLLELAGIVDRYRRIGAPPNIKIHSGR